eukprot:363785-Chlamydomonas_euryale.AAC.11
MARRGLMRAPACCQLSHGLAGGTRAASCLLPAHAWGRGGACAASCLLPAHAWVGWGHSCGLLLAASPRMGWLGALMRPLACCQPTHARRAAVHVDKPHVALEAIRDCVHTSRLLAAHDAMHARGSTAPGASRTGAGRVTA